MKLFFSTITEVLLDDRKHERHSLNHFMTELTFSWLFKSLIGNSPGPT